MQIATSSKLTLIKKLTICFSISAVCMLTALVYSVMNLSAVHRMEIEIASKDLPSATIVINLQELLLSQQRNAGRYNILKQQEFLDLYNLNVEKVLSDLGRLKQLYKNEHLDAFEKHYHDYLALTAKQFSGQTVEAGTLREAAALVENDLELIRKAQRLSLAQKLKISDERASSTINLSMGLAFGGVFVAFLISGLMLFTFASSISKLKKATHRIADGDFDHDPQINSNDEIGELSQDFRRMAKRLKELEQISLDASPLTRLPGNIAIERSINRRLRDSKPFAMCYLDLDNFKAYNDRYGYIKASEVIKSCAEMIHRTVKSLNDPDAFVGHIGGDDFVVIINNGIAPEVCQAIIKEFDAMVPSCYLEEDLRAGGIDGVDRYGVARRFPLLSISIAALICMPGDYETAAAIATAAAKVKDQVKESSGSNYVVVREADVYTAT
jgi:GGDEF domain-containing protein